MRTFGAVIIGDEILSGKRQDKHFAKIAEMLAGRGLRLSWVSYLGTAAALAALAETAAQLETIRKIKNRAM